jgi:hypothetical protein
LAGNDIGGFDAEVDIINAELFVEPLDLLVDERFGDPTSTNNELANCGRRVLVTTSGV